MLTNPARLSRMGFSFDRSSAARGAAQQFFGARSQISAVDADSPVFKKSAYELTYHQILQPGANAGPFFPPPQRPPWRSGARYMTDPLHLDDDAIETMVRALIQAYLADDARAAALDWLEKRTLTYQTVQSLALLDGEP
jgi:hypothetical protein